MVECQLPKLDVAGSSPVSRSTNENGPSGAVFRFWTFHPEPGFGRLKLQRGLHHRRKGSG